MSAYAEHIKTVCSRFDKALEDNQFESVLVYSGQPRVDFLDDNAPPYRVNPLFKYWVPVTESPKSAIFYRKGSQRPTVYLFQARDFWHAPVNVPEEEWQQHVDLKIIDDLSMLTEDLGSDLEQSAFIGEDFAQPVSDWKVKARNPQALIDHLHFHRSIKTEWEVDNLREANRLAAKAHVAAKEAFFAGKSELEIHHAYLSAIDFRESQVPYNSIVALNSDSAILHYDVYDTVPPKQIRSFLIDAGARYRGYCSDITRSYAYEEGFYADLVEAMDKAQQELLSEIKPGVSYYDLHVSMHLKVAQILTDFEFIKGDEQSIYDKGYTSAFMPHGLGHFIGLQVHDVGGFLKDDKGNSYERSERHPFLRLLRDIEVGHVFTIEPGLYVVDQLLEEHKDSADINWEKVDELRPYGGVRIEDSIVVGADGNENLTRDAFKELGAE
ncbi:MULTISPECIES: Xaa-Pro dipeptidase [unclassified Idiomarina]|jgi:Xaa-Pro dipeptidase|uniref:Xaa-Pro dipeptidase n=2 Tax=Idiomarina TaxID=135575 RepID=UPI000C69A372|nr:MULTISPECIES: Xaa-Pro dipeptidase [unclassified Idiomarina]MAA61946.1 Xaa-Pro dipeptidase [Idiomarina sp.]|tara:strand:+ start:6097 stop:7413 length:1317 start_codon:yes stop_codon:yes gene_type:complete